MSDFECRHGTYIGPSDLNGVNFYCEDCKREGEYEESESNVQELTYMYIPIGDRSEEVSTKSKSNIQESINGGISEKLSTKWEDNTRKLSTKSNGNDIDFTPFILYPIMVVTSLAMVLILVFPSEEECQRKSVMSNYNRLCFLR